MLKTLQFQCVAYYIKYTQNHCLLSVLCVFYLVYATTFESRQKNVGDYLAVSCRQRSDFYITISIYVNIFCMCARTTVHIWRSEDNRWPLNIFRPRRAIVRLEFLLPDCQIELPHTLGHLASQDLPFKHNL